MRALARCELPRLPGMGDKAFAEALAMLETLPRRRDDTNAGEIRFRIYRQCLSHLPAACMWWAVEQAVRRSKFFPSVKELLDIAEGWTRDDPTHRAHQLAKVIAAREAHRRLIAEQRRRPPPPPLTQADVDAMSPPMIALGLKVGALIRIEGKVVPNPEPDNSQGEQA